MSYKTPIEVFETRAQQWATRVDAEQHAARQREAEGRGKTAPLAAVPELDRYFFDLNGYFIIRKAVVGEELAALNAYADANNTAPQGGDLGLSAEEAQAMMADPHSPMGASLHHPLFSHFTQFDFSFCLDCWSRQGPAAGLCRARGLPRHWYSFSTDFPEFQFFGVVDLWFVAN